MNNDIQTVWSLIKDLQVCDTKTDTKAEREIELKCPCCQTNDIILEDSNYYCNLCSTLIDRFIDSSAEWRFYGGDDSKSNDPTR